MFATSVSSIKMFNLGFVFPFIISMLTHWMWLQPLGKVQMPDVIAPCIKQRSVFVQLFSWVEFPFSEYYNMHIWDQEGRVGYLAFYNTF